jgi:hypothetical protein
VKTNCRWGSASKSRWFMYAENKRVRFCEQDGQELNDFRRRLALCLLFVGITDNLFNGPHILGPTLLEVPKVQLLDELGQKKWTPIGRLPRLEVASHSMPYGGFQTRKRRRGISVSCLLRLTGGFIGDNMLVLWTAPYTQSP